MNRSTLNTGPAGNLRTPTILAALAVLAALLALLPSQARAQDAFAPFVVAATVDGSSVVLIYHEALDASSVPATSDYSVSVAGTAADAVKRQHRGFQDHADAVFGGFKRGHRHRDLHGADDEPVAGRGRACGGGAYRSISYQLHGGDDQPARVRQQHRNPVRGGERSRRGQTSGLRSRQRTRMRATH